MLSFRKLNECRCHGTFSCNNGLPAAGWLLAQIHWWEINGQGKQCVLPELETLTLSRHSIILTLFLLLGSEWWRINHVRSIDAGGIHRHFCIIHLLDGCCQAGCLVQQNPSRAGVQPVRRQSALAGSSVLHYRSVFIHLHFWCSLWLKKQAQQLGTTSPSESNCHNTGMRVSSVIWHFTSSREWFLLLWIKEWVTVSHALIARTWRFMTQVFIAIPWSHSLHARWRSL